MRPEFAPFGSTDGTIAMSNRMHVAPLALLGNHAILGLSITSAATQTLDRTANQWDTVAEEIFAHTWDCPNVFAVEAPISAPGVVAVT